MKINGRNHAWHKLNNKLVSGSGLQQQTVLEQRELPTFNALHTTANMQACTSHKHVHWCRGHQT